MLGVGVTLFVVVRVAAGAAGATAGLRTVRKIALPGSARGAPSLLEAVRATVAAKTVPKGRAALGLKTRTVSDSAQLVVPAMALPAALTANALAVVARSMDWLNRTEMAASRATSSVSVRGRKRMTDGAFEVRTAIENGARARPSLSWTPATIRRYRVSGARGLVGTNS